MSNNLLISNDLEQFLIIDIETASQYKSLDEFSEKNEKLSDLWIKKSESLSLKNLDKQLDESENDFYFKKAGLYPEFGKIIVISIGCILLNKDNNEITYRIHSFKDNDEKSLLEKFYRTIERYQGRIYPKDVILTGHNILNFDIPYINKRSIINNLALSPYLNFANKKPWEVKVQDTMNLWSFGNYQDKISLELLAETFNIETSKDDIKGEQVNEVYWIKNDLDRIVRYCEKDVKVVLDILKKLNNI